MGRQRVWCSTTSAAPLLYCSASTMLRRTSTVICRIPARNFGLSHVDERTGTPVMVDVSHKTASVRVAHAQVGDQYNDAGKL
jgi:hypothetical protein